VRTFRSVLAILAALLLPGLTQASSPKPGDASSGYEVVKDIEFAKPGGVSLTLDAHIPAGKGPFPAVILVHGGGWVGGDKTANFILPLFPTLDQTGYVWFTIDYRLAPRHPYPAPVQDVESAIQWVKANAKKYKVDKKRIALMGESAGAHLASLAATRSTPATSVAAVVSFYGPYDMVMLGMEKKDSISKLLSQVFQVPDLNPEALAVLREASPIMYARKNTPPFLLVHGTKDEAVPYEQSTMFQAYMKRLGARCDLITVEEGLHGVIRWESDPKFQGYKTAMVEWLHKTLGAP
jgi:alpha-L-fucosidase 2